MVRLTIGAVIALTLAWGFSVIWHAKWCNGDILAHLHRGLLIVYWPDEPGTLVDPWTGEPRIGRAPPHWGEQVFGIDVSRVESRRWLFRLPSIERDLFGRDWKIQVPIWFLIATVALPAILLALRTRLRRCEPRCPACGYNLTGNVSGVCPECGAAVPVNLVQRGDSAGQDSKAGPRNEQAKPEP